MTERITGDWNTLDPFLLFNQSAGQIAPALYDFLVFWDGAKFMPYLAASWTQKPTQIVFKLRSDVTCSDGEKLTPTVVANDFKRMLDPVRPATGIARNLGPGPYTVTADDANLTVTLGLGTPFADALGNLSTAGGGTGAILCSASTRNPASISEKPVGSGPYVVVEQKRGDFIRLKLRDDWKWGPGGLSSKTPGLPQEITYRNVDNETTAANLLLTGGINISAVRGPDVTRLEADRSLKEKVASVTAIDSMTFNQAAGRPTTDDALREALMTAVDPKAWNQAANSGRGTLSTSFFTRSASCFEPETAKLVPTPSTDKARKVLLAHGYTQDASGKILKDGKPLQIKYLDNVAHNSGPDYVYEQWQKVGLTVVLDKADLATFSAKYRAGDWDAVVYNYTNSSPSLSGAAALFSGAPPPAGFNFPRISDSELNSLVAKAQATIGEERCNAWKAAQRLVLQKHYVYAMAGQASYWFGRPGFEFAPESATQVQPTTLRSPPK